MKRRVRFTIVHGFVVSLALHSAVAVPFVAGRFVPKPDEPPTLVIDLRGLEADDQTEQQVLEQVKGAADPKKTVQNPTPVQDQPPPEPPPPEKQEAAEDPVVTPPTPPPQEVSPGKDKQNVKGTTQDATAQTVKTEPQPDLSEYFKLLTKKIKENMGHPENGRRASAMVSFTIMTDGTIRADTLKIAESSGQARLDASALQTVRASAPFDRPPQELHVNLFVDFDPKH